MWFRCPYPIHFNHIRVPVLAFYCLWIKLQRQREQEGERREGKSEASFSCGSAVTYKKGEESERQRPRYLILNSAC